MNLSNHLSTKKRTQSFVVLVGGLAVLFSLLFQFQYAFAENSFQKEKTASHAELKAKHSSDQLPFTPGPCEPSSLNEGETADDSDDEIHNLCGQLFAEGTEGLHSEKHIFVQLKTLIENRSTVSYFILYHCWKSFPAELA